MGALLPLTCWKPSAPDTREKAFEDAASVEALREGGGEGRQPHTAPPLSSPGYVAQSLRLIPGMVLEDQDQVQQCTQRERDGWQEVAWNVPYRHPHAASQARCNTTSQTNTPFGQRAVASHTCGQKAQAQGNVEMGKGGGYRHPRCEQCPSGCSSATTLLARQ